MEKAQQIDHIIKFSNAFGPSGFEQPVIRAYRDAVKDFGTTEIDGMFNAITKRQGNTGEQPVIQLDAHADEVGLLVQAVRPSGLLKFVTLGGFVPTNVPAMRVLVRNRRGEYIPGVVATKPPHFMTAAERNAVPSIAEMSVDVGSTSRDETINDYAIDTGCPIVPDVACTYDDAHGICISEWFVALPAFWSMVHDFSCLNIENLNVFPTTGLQTQR